ncbi:MAG TPA: hypothetical protein VGH58_01765 [Solirubrobacterales bacterium]
MLRRRLSTPRATIVVALAAVLAAAIAVTPSFAGSSKAGSPKAGSFITKKAASRVYVSNKKASTLYLKKKAATNTFVAKASAPLSPVAAIAAGTAPWSSEATAPVSLPTAYTSFGMPGTGSAVVTFSGSVTCTSAKPTVELACPIQILIDGQTTGKINFAQATASSPSPAAIVNTVMQTTVLGKGGHTVAIQYAGAKNVVFTLKSWSLAVQAYPQRPEAVPTTATK